MIRSRSTPSYGSELRSIATKWGSGSWPGMPTVWPCCETAESAGIPSGAVPERIRRPSPKTVPWLRNGGDAAVPVPDPADHTRLRGLVAKAFTPKVVESLRKGTRQVVDELLDAAMEDRRHRSAGRVRLSAPMRVICDLLDLPAEDRDRCKGGREALAPGWIRTSSWPRR